MPGKIQVIPPGYLGFLQIKSEGRNPVEATDAIVPTFDMRTWYFQANMENTTGSRTIPDLSLSVANFGATALIVPEGEWWWIESYTVRSGGILAAGETIDWQLGYAMFGAVNHYVMKGPRTTHAGNAAGTVMPWTACGEFFVPPGAQLIIMVNEWNVAAGGNLTEAFVRFVRLPV